MSATTFTSDIKLGDRYRVTHTELEGIATACYFYLHGCERVNIEVINHDGELKEYVFDAPRLVHVKTGIAATTTRTGGPSKGGSPIKSDGRR